MRRGPRPLPDAVRRPRHGHPDRRRAVPGRLPRLPSGPPTLPAAPVHPQGTPTKEKETLLTETPHHHPDRRPGRQRRALADRRRRAAPPSCTTATWSRSSRSSTASAIPERIVHAKGGGAFGTFEVTGDVSAYTRVAVFQPGAEGRHGLHASPPSPASRAPPTPGATCAVSRRGSTRPRATTTSSATTPRCSSSATASSSPTSSTRRSASRAPACATPTCSGTSGPSPPSPRTRSPTSWATAACRAPGARCTASARTPTSGSTPTASASGCKYHFPSNQGEHNISNEEAEALAGADADYYRRDLYEAIDAGDFPSWDLHVQVMPYEDAKTYRFNPFDLTKVWPHADYPLIKVGTHHAQPQPGELLRRDRADRAVPGERRPGPSRSPRTRCCMARIFSYPDAQRYRVGTNYNELPVNRPNAPVNNYSQDGAAAPRLQRPRGPGLRAELLRRPGRRSGRAPADGTWENDGALVRAAATLHAEDGDFGQAGTLYRDVFDDARQGPLPRHHHRCRRRRHARRDQGTRHPVLDQRRRRPRRQAARQPGRRPAPVRRRGRQQGLIGPLQPKNTPPRIPPRRGVLLLPQCLTAATVGDDPRPRRLPASSPLRRLPPRPGGGPSWRAGSARTRGGAVR